MARVVINFIIKLMKALKKKEKIIKINFQHHIHADTFNNWVIISIIYCPFSKNKEQKKILKKMPEN